MLAAVYAYFCQGILSGAIEPQKRFRTATRRRALLSPVTRAFAQNVAAATHDVACKGGDGSAVCSASAGAILGAGVIYNQVHTA